MMQSFSCQIHKFLFLSNKYQLIIYQMLNVMEQTNSSDLDQNHFLNGNGSVVIIPKVKKTSSKSGNNSGSNRLTNQIKNNLIWYLLLLTLLVTVLLIVHIEKDYQSTLDQTLAQNNQLKQILKETVKASKSTSYEEDIEIPTKKEQNKYNVEIPNLQPSKTNQPVAHTTQYNKVDNKENLNSIPQQLNLEKLKAKTLQQSSAASTKNNQSIEKPQKNNKTKINQNKQINQQKSTSKSPPLPPKQPPAKQRTKPPPNQNTPVKAIAGITQEQRTKAQKWLGLKNQNIYEDTNMAKQERKYYQGKYNISQFEQLPVCIVIPSHNNVKNSLHIKNMKSVIMQEYTNFHIVFIDDASSDGTGDQIQKFLANQTKVSTDRYVVIKNKEQKRAMPNLRRAAKQFCKPQQIFIIVDGDDQLLGRQVLKLFNSMFQKNKVWFVYSNFLSIRGTIGYSRPFPQNTINGNKYRSYPFVTSHLRAFYTQLFINIKEEDLKDDVGEYLKAANDVAICIPILEMSHQRVMYLPELNYYYNSNTGQNNHHVRLKQQKSNDRMLRKRKSYPRLKELQFGSLNIIEERQVSPKVQNEKQKSEETKKNNQ